MSALPIAVLRDLPASQQGAPAQTQHAALCAALESLGARLVRLTEGTDALASQVGVAVPGLALATRPGPAEEALRQLHSEVHSLPAGAHLDPRDVLRLGHIFFYSRSPGTDAAGIAALRQVFGRGGVRFVEIPALEGQPLSRWCGRPTESLVFLAGDSLDTATFCCAGHDALVLPRGEDHAVGALGWQGKVLLPPECPQTAEILQARGHQVIEVDTSELAPLGPASQVLFLLPE